MIIENPSIKDKTDFTIKMLKKRKKKKIKQNEGAVYDAVRIAVRRCTRK
jgi:hypothetical protein